MPWVHTEQRRWRTAHQDSERARALPNRVPVTPLTRRVSPVLPSASLRRATTTVSFGSRVRMGTLGVHCANKVLPARPAHVSNCTEKRCRHPSLETRVLPVGTTQTQKGLTPWPVFSVSASNMGLTSRRVSGKRQRERNATCRVISSPVSTSRGVNWTFWVLISEQ